MNAIKILENRTNSVLADRKRDIEERENQLKEAQATLERANELLNIAIDSGDTKAYQKAKVEKTQAEDNIELYTQRLSRLKESPLITQKEYEKYSQNVHIELAEMTARHRKEVVEIIDKLITIRDEESAMFEKGNKALKKWQHDVYHDADRLRSNDGRATFGNENKVTDFSVCDFILRIKEDGYYRAFKDEYEKQKADA